MSRILILLLMFLAGFAGCQTTPTQPLGNIFSPSTTIPPPGTNSYTVNSAPSQETLNASTNSGEVSPFASNRPYADLAPVQEEPKTETAVQPFHASQPEETAGSVKAVARSGDEIAIPVSAFRSDTGLYSSDSGTSQSSAAGTTTVTTQVEPFQSE